MKTSCVASLILAAFILWSCGTATSSAGLSIPHPDDASKRIEYFIAKPVGDAPWATVILLRGKQLVEWGVLRKLADRGYLAVAISQPGYGNSTGPADFSGAFTQHAVSGVIAELRADGLAAPDRLVIEGISRGALTAGLIAAQDSSVSGGVLISGVHDLPAYVCISVKVNVSFGAS